MGRLARVLILPLALESAIAPGWHQAQSESQRRRHAASISGVVVASATKEPIRGAVIRVTSDIGSFEVATGHNGRYVLKGLPASRFLAVASKTGYVSMAYATDHAAAPMAPVNLGADQQVDGIDFALQLAGVITGVVVDEIGDPVAGANVAVRPTGPNADAITAIGSTASTDDRGEFRVGGLAAGAYVLRVGRDITDVPMGAERLGDVEVVLSDRLPAIEGTVRDSRGALLNNYSVFVFPTNPALWTAGSRYVRVVPSNAVSEFSVEGLPPERYFVVATRSLGLFQIYDRVRLKSLSRDAERILVGETDRSTVELVFRE